jgi:flagellar biosynthesis protein FlhF
MRIKKFTAATIKAATETMRQELGDDAIILNTRRVSKGGMLGFLSKDEYEITGAIDEQQPGAFAKELSALRGNRPAGEAADETTFASLQKVAQRFEHRVKETPAARGAADSLQAIAGFQDLKSEVESLRAVVEEVAEHFRYSKMPALPEHLRSAYTTLVSQAVDEQLAADLTQRVYRKLGEDLLSDKQEIERCLVAELAAAITTAPPSTPRKGKVVALIGPTGVGKTTTIAKIAATEKLLHNQNVALISADTYRIGAIEQLRTFAAIANIPMQVVYEPREMRDALAAFKDADVVFVDTVGRSQRMKKEIAELGAFIRAACPHEVHLVLSATANEQTLTEVIANFRSVGPNRMIFSKCDEAVTYGQLVNIAHTSRLPLSYITTGQNVPDDISVASNMQLARMVYAGEFVHA